MSMYRIFVDGLEMPWGTPKMTSTIKNRDEEIELINGQTMTRIKAPGLSTFDFDVYLPDPDLYLAKFNELKLEQKPFQLIVIREQGKKSTNVTVTLVDYSRDEDSKYGSVSKVALSFKEYISFKTGSVTVEVPEYVPVNPNKPSEGPGGAVNVFQSEISRIEKLNPPAEYKVKSKFHPGTGLIPPYYTLESWKVISKQLLGDEKYAIALSIVNESKRNNSPWYSPYGQYRFPGTLYPKPKAILKIDVKAIVETYHKLESAKNNE